MMHFVFLLILDLLVSLAGFVTGWTLTEVVRLPLHFKPFNCRPCMTFWATLALFASLAWPAGDLLCFDLPAVRVLVIWVGVLHAFINFLIVKLLIRVYE